MPSKVACEGRRTTRPELSRSCVGSENSSAERGVVKLARVWAQFSGILEEKIRQSQSEPV